MPKYLSKTELKRKRAWYRIMSSLMDFFGSVGSFIAILVCAALITTVLAWLKVDIPQTLSEIIESVKVAVVGHEDDAFPQ